MNTSTELSFIVGPFVSYDCKRAYGWGTPVAQFGRASDNKKSLSRRFKSGQGYLFPIN
jgi:hypothetical protein